MEFLIGFTRLHGWLAGILTYLQTLFSEVYSLLCGEIKVMKKSGCSCGIISCYHMHGSVFVVFVLFLRRQEKNPERTNLSVPHRCVSLPATYSWCQSYFCLTSSLAIVLPFCVLIKHVLLTCSSEFTCMFMLMFKSMGCWKSDWGKGSSKRGIEWRDQFCNVLIR